MSRPVLRAGAPARYDSLHGLLPVRVLHIGAPITPGGSRTVRVRVTHTRGAYKAGDEFETTSTWVAPREAIWRGRILPYEVEGE